MIESFRNGLFAGYKTGEGVPPDLMSQFAPAEEALEALGVTVWAMREFEADDALATAALRWADEVDKVVILSPDKDLAQCVIGNRVVTYNRRERKQVDEAGVMEKFGGSARFHTRLPGPGGGLRRRHPRHSRMGRQVHRNGAGQIPPHRAHPPLAR